MIQELGKIVLTLSDPPLSYLACCPVKKYPVSVKVHHSHDRILLWDYAQLPIYIALIVSDIRQIFKFKEHIVQKSQILLHNASKGEKNITWCGGSCQKNELNKHLNLLHNTFMVKPDFFLRQKNLLRNKFKPIMFVVVSDDPKWCEHELHGDDVVVIRNKSPEQDLAIMSACNHSIIDYGTYGMWGAILSGVDTFVYNLTDSKVAAFEMASLLPNWHIVT
jgi:galactoside 2-L-fucosyltransferase 1/2